ncbi:MAG: hypothetical protein JWN77_704 [Frankiales bacterium]|nr:hypothetical protein [Frankiales bacterium]
MLRDRCDGSWISYAHFGTSRGRSLPPQELPQILRSAASWSEAMMRAGYSSGSGSAQTSLRRSASSLGVDKRR